MAMLNLFQTLNLTKRLVGTLTRQLCSKNQIEKRLILEGTSRSYSRYSSSSNKLIFRQLFDRLSCTYTYLLADTSTREAVLIDPVIELADRDVELLKDLGLFLKYAMNTHVHADHITGSGMLKQVLPETKSLIAKASGATADLHVEHGDKVHFGSRELEVRNTPGHTNGCVSFVDHQHRMVFTGDALLIRGCGRTDFQEGDAEKLFDSVHSQIFSLPDDYLVYPAHDYNGCSVSTVGEEKELNPRLSRSKNEFIDIMEHLGLPYPDRIDESLPANKVCGLYNLPDHLAEAIEKARP